jgi:Na+/pantothenate symporter
MDELLGTAQSISGIGAALGGGIVAWLKVIERAGGIRAIIDRLLRHFELQDQRSVHQQHGEQVMTGYGMMIGGLGVGIGGLGIATLAFTRLAGRTRSVVTISICVLSILIMLLAVGLAFSE